MELLIFEEESVPDRQRFILAQWERGKSQHWEYHKGQAECDVGGLYSCLKKYQNGNACKLG